MTWNCNYPGTYTMTAENRIQPSGDADALKPSRQVESRAEESTRKVLDNARNDFVYTEKDLTSRWTTLVERYAHNWTEIHIHIFSRDAGQYCAVFYGAGIDKRLRRRVYRKAGYPKSAVGSTESEIEMTVLVDVAETFERPEHGVSKGVSSTARLQVLDRCHHRFAHASEPTRRTTLELMNVVADQEGGAVGGGVPSLKDELPRQVVEGGSVVIKGVPNKGIE